MRLNPRHAQPPVDGTDASGSATCSAANRTPAHPHAERAADPSETVCRTPHSAATPLLDQPLLSPLTIDLLQVQVALFGRFLRRVHHLLRLLFLMLRRLVLGKDFGVALRQPGLLARIGVLLLDKIVLVEVRRL